MKREHRPEAGVEAVVARRQHVREVREVAELGRRDVRRLAPVRPLRRPGDRDHHLQVVTGRRADERVQVGEAVGRVVAVERRLRLLGAICDQSARTWTTEACACWASLKFASGAAAQRKLGSSKKPTGIRAVALATAAGETNKTMSASSARRDVRDKKNPPVFGSRRTLVTVSAVNEGGVKSPAVFAGTCDNRRAVRQNQLEYAP